MTYKIALIGEAWGAEEEKARAPFVGASGHELTRMLSEAGIHRADCFLTNVFNLRPKDNDIENLCGDKASALVGYPALRPGKFVRQAYSAELGRLRQELLNTRPNITILLGNTPAWALLGSSGITRIRGAVVQSTHTLPNLKCLPTFHPAAILREWSNRAVTVLDLAKGKREAEYPDIRRPARTVYCEPGLSDLDSFFREHIVGARAISFDIETSGNQITCIGFAPSPHVAIVVPFVDHRKPGNSYWPDTASEIRAWDFVRRVLSTPQPKIAQNGLYDIHFLWRGYGIAVVNATEDTMLLHHSLQPESQKGLGFLGSVYTNEQAWKLLGRKGIETIKRDA